jgi:hypothetical protein
VAVRELVNNNRLKQTPESNDISKEIELAFLLRCWAVAVQLDGPESD